MARLFVAVAYLFVGLFVWKAAAIEVLGAHDGEVVLSCPDDAGGCGDDCDCGTDCHSCLGCAHQGQPGIAGTLDCAPVRILSFSDLAASPPSDLLPSADRGPPIKVPKHHA